MARAQDYELVCIECGRPLEFEGDEYCEQCLQKDEKQRRRPHRLNIGSYDGKRLPKSRRPKRHASSPRDE